MAEATRKKLPIPHDKALHHNLGDVDYALERARRLVSERRRVVRREDRRDAYDWLLLRIGQLSSDLDEVKGWLP